MKKATLQDWAEHGWLSPYQPTAQEVANQLREVDRELSDAGQNISADSRFVIAYNAALRLAAVALSAASFRASREQRHYRTIVSLPVVIGGELSEMTEFLDHCRVKRNDVTYESVGAISTAEADELVSSVLELKRVVLQWLAKEHRELL